MSANHDATHGHEDGAVHAHVSSIPFYGAIFLGLLILTALTVGQSYVDLGRLNLAAVVIIASMKASLVLLFFMHLRHDAKFNGLMIVACIGFIGIFFVYTFNDVGHRGEFDGDSSVWVNARNGEAAPGSMEPRKHESETPAAAPGGSAAPAPAHGGEHH
jgi:cytochrome c oxidase subunit IV